MLQYKKYTQANMFPLLFLLTLIQPQPLQAQFREPAVVQYPVVVRKYIEPPLPCYHVVDRNLDHYQICPKRYVIILSDGSRFYVEKDEWYRQIIGRRYQK